MIKTDGVSVSILFVRVDDKGEPVKKQKGKKYKEQIGCEYIEKAELTEEQKKMKMVNQKHLDIHKIKEDLKQEQKNI